MTLFQIISKMNAFLAFQILFLFHKMLVLQAAHAIIVQTVLIAPLHFSDNMAAQRWLQRLNVPLRLMLILILFPAKHAHIIITVFHQGKHVLDRNVLLALDFYFIVKNMWVLPAQNIITCQTVFHALQIIFKMVQMCNVHIVIG